MSPAPDRSVADIIRDAVQHVRPDDGQSLADAILAVPANAISSFLARQLRCGDRGSAAHHRYRRVARSRVGCRRAATRRARSMLPMRDGR